MVELEVLRFGKPLAEELVGPGPGALTMYWLGQAGFVLRWRACLLLIDPYLSDSLAEKYKGKELPHRRLMPIPVAPEALRGVTAVLCTHRHTDHMDRGTLPLIARGNPGCRFFVPKAEADHAESLGLPRERLHPIDAGETVRMENGVEVEVIPSAHEELARNERGEYHYLGYIVSIGGVRLYHSGDCVPYPGLEETLRAAAIDAALMPVNGRSPELTAKGISGNFFLEETISLCRAAGIPVVICHHWGMFDFNTVDPKEAARAIDVLGTGMRCILPGLDSALRITKR